MNVEQILFEVSEALQVPVLILALVVVVVIVEAGRCWSSCDGGAGAAFGIWKSGR